MPDNVLYGIDFRAKRARDEAELHAFSQAMVPDEVFEADDGFCECGCWIRRPRPDKDSA